MKGGGLADEEELKNDLQMLLGKRPTTRTDSTQGKRRKLSFSHSSHSDNDESCFDSNEDLSDDLDYVDDHNTRKKKKPTPKK